jgi:hypothetical protein
MVNLSRLGGQTPLCRLALKTSPAFRGPEDSFAGVACFFFDDAYCLFNIAGMQQ